MRARILAGSSPAALAKHETGGLWIGAPHLQEVDRAILEAVYGTGPRQLIVTMPPRHGKSEYCSKYLPSWYLGRFPSKRVILTSYAAEFAASWGRKSRDLLSQQAGSGIRTLAEDVFGVRVAESPAAANNWAIDRWGGSMTTAGAGGQITGKGGDLLIADDPVKNAEQAASRLQRDKIWDWWGSTFYTRREPGAIVVLIQTRWNEDDLAGRLIREQPDEWRVINFPALSPEGRALWAGRYNVKDLLQIKQALGSYYWSALYQQDPIAEGGLIFQKEWLKLAPEVPNSFDYLVRYWDKAGSELSTGDYSAGVLLGKSQGLFWVLDVQRGRWSPFARNRIIYETAAADKIKYGGRVKLWIEQEPGNGGKESAMISARELAEFGPHFETPSVDKTTRARPFAAQCEAGNVRVASAVWASQYLDELVHFPAGEHDDQVDGTSGAFNKLVIYGKPPQGGPSSYTSKFSTVPKR